MVMQAWAIYNPTTGEIKTVTVMNSEAEGFKSAWDMSIRDWEEFAGRQNAIVERCKVVLDALKETAKEI